MRHLIIRQARVVSDGRVSDPCDVQIMGHRIHRIGAVDTSADAEELDAAGAYLSAGWIDLHAHIYPGVSELGLDPDQIGLRTGVHLVVDAGSSGATTFPGFRDYVAKRSTTAVRALLHISSMGLVVVKGATELPDLRWVQPEAAIAVARDNPEWIRGIKVRVSGTITGHLGLAPLKLARAVAREVGRPLMVHVGEMPPDLSEILDLLQEGDMVTHCFHGKLGGIFTAKGEPLPALMRARERGVWLDIGHGAASYAMAVARRAIHMGIVPDTISTDLHIRNVNGPVHDLATTMSKLLAAGMSLPQVVEAVTASPARWLGETNFGQIAEGAEARLTLFRMEESPRTGRDATGAEETLPQWFRPLVSITPEDRVVCT